MIVVNNLIKTYDDLEVLKGVSFIVSKGEVVSLVGSSGAGKSTLLYILGTLDKADSGDVIINNTNIKSLKGKRLARFRNAEIGFVFQFHHLLPEFNALENVCIPAYINNTDSNEVVGRAKDLLDYLGLKDRMDHKPSELSGGEQQRVAVARALINNPSVILADEPSGNLDSQNALDLHNLFFKLRKEFEQIFIIATHNKELAKLSDRTLQMVDGVIV